MCPVKGSVLTALLSLSLSLLILSPSASTAHPTVLILLGELHYTSSSWVRLIPSLLVYPPWLVIQEALGLLWTLWNPVQDLPQCPHGTVTGLNWHVPEKTLPAACEQPVSGGRLPWSQQMLSFGGLGGCFVPLPPVPCPFLPIHHLPASLHPRRGAGQEAGSGQGTWITRHKPAKLP